MYNAIINTPPMGLRDTPIGFTSPLLLQRVFANDAQVSGRFRGHNWNVIVNVSEQQYSTQ